MQRNWKRLPKDYLKPQHSAPYSVSLSPKGIFLVSQRTWENMARPEAFQVLFDEKNSSLGLRAVSREDDDAYPIARGTRQGSAKVIRANRLIHEWGISLPDTMRFVHPAPDQDGILILDLRTAEISQQAVHHWTRKRKRPDGPALKAEIFLS